MTLPSPPPLKPLAWYKKLATKKGRLAAGAFLVEGEKAIRQIARREPAAILELLIHDPRLSDLPYPDRELTASQLRTICQTTTPQGCAAVVRLPPQTYSSQLPASSGANLLLLEDIQDPGNVGTLIRTAAAFRFAGVILTDKCADPFAPKCVQATAGSILSLWLRRTSDIAPLIQALQHNGYTLAAADLQGDATPSVLHTISPLVLALGNEATGLSPATLQAAQVRFAIPMARDNAESLNVAASGAICMYLSAL